MLPLLMALATQPEKSAGPADCPWLVQSFGAGREYRLGSSASEYAAVREEDRCERMWLELYFGKVLRPEGLASPEARGPALELTLIGDPQLQLYAERETHRYVRLVESGSTGGYASLRIGVPGRASLYRLVHVGTGTTTLAAGDYYFALGHRGEPLAEVQRRVTLGGPTTVEIGLQSYHTERLIGAGAFALGVLSMVTGLIWAIVGSGEEGGNIPPIAIGVSGLGLTVGGAMMVFGLFAHDEVTFDVRPQAPSN